MELVIPIPEWAEGETIRVLGGINLIAIKEPGKPLEVKTKRCDRCGRCCQDLPDTWVFETVDGVCVHLTDNGTGDGKTRCKLGVKRPTLCSVDKTADASFCRTEFKKVDGNR